ncbi:alpha/beta hydrolase [Nocardioides sp. SYSU D00038]|uniref:alpha/beta fold hydrolase n=1 Tax=Nocardioides sp. SYSU D00038 TaxID=2812554 RepID=UPI0027DD4A35|nr:alpha/beta hydrolase [Nocardioides sp. SYSU D00038]
MSRPTRILGVVAGTGLAAAGTVALGVARRRRGMTRRPDDHTPFGSLRSTPRTVVADDGVPLHVEVDEPDPAATEAGAGPVPTLVFVHGYALNLDCWHFQRAAYRGLVRAVYYDQRSHGRSGRSAGERATIDQLGRDLRRVLDEVVPDGPVVLVGHSMGGMTIVALAEQHPELVGERVVGVALVSTTAGGLDPGRIVLPMLPTRLSGDAALHAVRTLRRGHRLVDGARRAGRAFAAVATDVLAFGDEVPTAYVDFVDDMLSATPFEVVADFFPSFRSLDKFDFVEVLGRVPTTIVCGTADRLTSIGHSRKLHARIAGSTMVEVEGAGHLVILERHGQVNAALDQLVAAARERVGSP